VSPTSVRTLLWTAAILALVGAMVGSPAGGLLVLAVAALLGAIAAVPGTRRTRIVAALLTVACLALAAARFAEARREMARYRAAAARTSR
jgi:hypothetical protein